MAAPLASSDAWVAAARSTPLSTEVDITEWPPVATARRLKGVDSGVWLAWETYDTREDCDARYSVEKPAIQYAMDASL